VGTTRGMRAFALIFLGVAGLWSPSPAWPSEQSQRLYNAGVIPFHAGRYDAALPLFQQAAETDAQDYLAVYYLGVTYGKLEKYEASVPHLEKAVALRPDFIPARQDLAVSYFHLQRYQDAIRHLEEAEQRDPQNGLLHYYKGLCYYRLNEPAAAIPALTTAAKLEPLIRYKAHYYVGLSYLTQDKPQEAQQALQIVTQSPDTDLAFRAANLITEINKQSQAPGADKRWQLRVGVGSQFDSNVVLQPDDGAVPGQISDKEDFRFTFSFGGRYDLWRTSSTYLMADYSFYQTVHTDISDFDLQSHLFRLIGAWAVSRSLNVGLEGGTNYFRVGNDDYLHEIYGLPFVSFFAKPWAYTYLSYRLTNEDYLTSFFDSARDGITQTMAVRQYFLLDEFDRYLFLGYQYEVDSPGLRVGNDFEYDGNQVEVGVRSPLPFDLVGEATYSFRNKDYNFANSRTNFTRERNDDMHNVLLILRRKLTPYLEVNLSYSATVNNSNIDDFQYDRHIVSLGFDFVF